jgi:hypothetical protein
MFHAISDDHTSGANKTEKTERATWDITLTDEVPLRDVAISGWLISTRSRDGNRLECAPQDHNHGHNDRLQIKDIKLIGKFVEVYCKGKHRTAERTPVDLPENLGQRNLSPEYAPFLRYAITRRLKCPLEAEKPSCKHCKTYCYAKPQLAKVKKPLIFRGLCILTSSPP